MALGIRLHTARKTIFALALGSALASALVAAASVMMPPETHRKMDLTSPAFTEGQPIPGPYTCDDKNISPPLAWSGAPANTASFVLIVDDPDAPARVWTHWILFNLPGDKSEIPEDATHSKTFPTTAQQGLNDFKHPTYGGPCPPTGQRHRYFFKIYALDINLNLPNGTSKDAVAAAMAKHVLAQGILMGTYQRK
jgi:Raf kinase inhibitor-like YbhB/YbcL family protein